MPSLLGLDTFSCKSILLIGWSRCSSLQATLSDFVRVWLPHRCFIVRAVLFSEGFVR